MKVSAIDIGSTTIRTALGSGRRVDFSAQPHVYLDFPDDEGSRRLVERFDLGPRVVEGRILVVGDDAVELAGALGRAPVPSFERGLPRSSNRLALAATRELIERLLGPSDPPGRACVFEMPGGALAASPVAQTGGMEIGAVIASLGYEPEPVSPVAAAGLSAFGSTGSGLLVLIGQTFSHVAVMIQGDCAAAVSSARGGQIIDRECADALGLDAERMRLLRERGVDLARPHTREEEAIAVYVRTTVSHLVLSLKGREGLLEIAAGASGGEIPVMLAGGFARTGGLGGPVGQELVPLTRAARIGEPEALEDPELAVLKGCMMVAAAQAVQ